MRSNTTCCLAACVLVATLPAPSNAQQVTMAIVHGEIIDGKGGAPISDGVVLVRDQRYLNALLYAGVTTVLDLSNVLPYIEQIRQEVSARRIPGPAIHMAAPLIDGAAP